MSLKLGKFNPLKDNRLIQDIEMEFLDTYNIV